MKLVLWCEAERFTEASRWARTRKSRQSRRGFIFLKTLFSISENHLNIYLTLQLNCDWRRWSKKNLKERWKKIKTVFIRWVHSLRVIVYDFRFYSFAISDAVSIYCNKFFSDSRRPCASAFTFITRKSCRKAITENTIKVKWNVISNNLSLSFQLIMLELSEQNSEKLFISRHVSLDLRNAFLAIAFTVSEGKFRSHSGFF